MIISVLLLATLTSLLVAVLASPEPSDGPRHGRDPQAAEELHVRARFWKLIDDRWSFEAAIDVVSAPTAVEGRSATMAHD
nr:hypothetical protein [Paraburkholderia sp. BL8N3]